MYFKGVCICPAADRDHLNAAMMALDPRGGRGTFVAGLSPTGQGEPTHFWSVARMADTAVALIPLLANSFPNTKLWIWTLSGDVEWLNTTVGAYPNVFTGETTPEVILELCGLKPLGD